MPFATLSKHPEVLVEWKVGRLKFRYSEFFMNKSELISRKTTATALNPKLKITHNYPEYVSCKLNT